MYEVGGSSAKLLRQWQLWSIMDSRVTLPRFLRYHFSFISRSMGQKQPNPSWIRLYYCLSVKFLLLKSILKKICSLRHSGCYNNMTESRPSRVAFNLRNLSCLIYRHSKVVNCCIFNHNSLIIHYVIPWRVTVATYYKFLRVLSRYR